MGKFRYIHLILILGLTSGLVVGFPVLSEASSDVENTGKTELEEICKFEITVKETDLKQLLDELKFACEKYEKSRNILFEKLKQEIVAGASPTTKNLVPEIEDVNSKLTDLQQANSNLNTKIKAWEDRKIEFHDYLFKNNTFEIYQIKQKLSKTEFTEIKINDINQEAKLEEFIININKEDLKISQKIQEIQDKLSKFENIRQQEQRQKILDLLLQSLTLFITNAVVTLILLRIVFNTDNKSSQTKNLQYEIRKLKSKTDNHISQYSTNNNQVSRKINQLIESFNNLEKKISNPQQTQNYYPQNPSSSTTNRNYPSTPQTPLTKQITSLRSGNINFDEPAQPGVVEKYNLNPASLKSVAIPVLVTEDSITETRSGRQQNIILQRDRRGNYWIVNDSGTNYLVPEDKFKINTFNFNTTIALFECNNYEASSSRNFHLIKPARVSVVTDDEIWQLEERGILQFE